MSNEMNEIAIGNCVERARTAPSRPRGRLLRFWICLLILPLVGCRSIGPSTVKRDRLHYSTAVADSWKEQLLLNIVKTRYGDAPAFLEVASVVSGYSLETGVSLNGQFSPENLRGDSFAGGELSGKFTDRPTISYSPMTGEKFARSLMAPVPLDSLLFTTQGGAPADFVLGLTVQSIEGFYNRQLNAGEYREEDPEFVRILQLFRSMQQMRVLETEIVKRGEEREVWLRLHTPGASGHAAVEQAAELKALLGLAPELDRARVVFGTESPEPGVVAMRTRSLMQILSALGAGVQVQQEHLDKGIAFAAGSSSPTRRFTVHSGREKPERAFAAVPYEGLWFWIDRQDLASKATLAALTVLFNFLEGGGSKTAPVLTIPTN